MTNRPPTGDAIRKSLDTLIINHSSFSAAFDALERSIRDTLNGFKPCFEMLTGFSRCGKTELLKLIAMPYPEVQIGGRRQVPLLVVYITSSTTPKDLPLAVIRALSLPTPRHSMKVGELNNYMHTQIRLAGVRVILFDEASHLVDVGVKIPPRAASDWFKDVQANAKDLGIVLSGVPRLLRLLDSNEQLRNRMRKPIRLMPYRWDDEEQRKSFAGCVSAFLNEFLTRGCSLGMAMNTFTKHCYAASAGQIGLLANFFHELAMLIDEPCLLDHELCLEAAANLNLPGNRTVFPFINAELDDIDLLRVLNSEYHLYNLSLSPLSVESELASAKVRAYEDMEVVR